MITETEVLIFPDTTTMADFIIENDVNGIEVDSLAQSITGTLPTPLVYLARLRYEAFSERVVRVSP
jgi:hypothetical protein